MELRGTSHPLDFLGFHCFHNLFRKEFIVHSQNTITIMIVFRLMQGVFIWFLVLDGL